MGSFLANLLPWRLRESQHNCRKHPILGRKFQVLKRLLTDKNPSAGSFEYTTSAIIAVGDLCLSVTLFHHQKDLPARQTALEILKNATQKSFDPPPRVGKPTTVRVASLDGKWQLVCSSIGLEITRDQTDEGRMMRQVNTIDKETGLEISVFLEPAAKPGDSTVARGFYWDRAQRIPLPMEQVKFSKSGDIAMFEYAITKARGHTLNMRSINLFLVHEGVWIDVHISKALVTEKDQPVFEQIIKSVKIEPITSR
jgi:hypothetical protein